MDKFNCKSIEEKLNKIQNELNEETSKLKDIAKKISEEYFDDPRDKKWIPGTIGLPLDVNECKISEESEMVDPKRYHVVKV